MKDVSVAFFLLSALTIGLYLIMYMLMYAAGIRLRYTQPQLPRSYRVPGGNAGMWIIGGCGFLALLFFLPPDGSMGNMIVALASGIVAVVVAFIACTVILKKAYKEDV